MDQPENCIIVIFGASGDLTQRKLVPALFDLYRKKLLPEGFAVLGVSRTSLTDTAFRNQIAESLTDHSAKTAADKTTIKNFLKRLHYLTIDTAKSEHYKKLNTRLKSLDAQYHVNGNFIFYLSISPSMYETIVDHLGTIDLQKSKRKDRSDKRIIIEKPFGCDLASALSLNKKLHKVFQEQQIYRIDHYLGKETVQNILVFRFSNGIFEPLWNRNYISHIEITAAETVGVEKRGKYYDGAGALRDMVQNHLLQVLTVIAMEPPSSFEAFAVRNEKVKVFQSLRPIQKSEVNQMVV
ncbi:MAG: glucose-6-phosphate dehydrogenase (NADP(+)), partial [Nitrospinota bacterium]|nr:glucose-6-phosphate dehydrogenase (NADP(+)) [Nitrospinota bacterium]